MKIAISEYNIELDLVAASLVVNGVHLRLARTEYVLLAKLLSEPETWHSVETLAAHANISPSAVSKTITYLRIRLPRGVISTSYGRGYGSFHRNITAGSN